MKPAAPTWVCSPTQTSEKSPILAAYNC